MRHDSPHAILPDSLIRNHRDPGAILDPLNTVAQEPSIVCLPDKRLFCVMRTMTGYIWYSVSSDSGETWGNLRPLLRKDHGQSASFATSSTATGSTYTRRQSYATGSQGAIG